MNLHRVRRAASEIITRAAPGIEIEAGETLARVDRLQYNGVPQELLIVDGQIIYRLVTGNPEGFAAHVLK